MLDNQLQQRTYGTPQLKGAIMIITDLTPYRKYVDVFDITEKQKLELVNTLWAIIENIMDQHFGLYQLEQKDDTNAEIEPKTP